jgi:hypothetical protein
MSVRTGKNPMATLSDLAQRCSTETERFFRGQEYDPEQCFELFRRAILKRDQRAWEAIYAQYEPLVKSWVSRHPGYPSSGEEMPYFVNRAFEKIWAALTPEKFGRFPELEGLLRYLKLCVHSVISDHNRAKKLDEQVALTDQAVSPQGEHENPVEERALAQAGRLSFWEAIRARLNNEVEEQVVYGSFVLGLKPGEILDEFSQTFSDVEEIYRVKQNVLARLRRDQALENLFEMDD